MLAAKYCGIGSIRMMEVDVPGIGPDEVLVRTRAAGICASDLQAYQVGHQGLADYTPETGGLRTPGHEFAGEVADVGPNVQGVRKGMRVAVAPNYGCGQCRFCRRGIYPLCPRRTLIGLDVDGGFAEYVRIPAAAVTQGVICPFEENLSFEAAALSEPLACAFNGFTRCSVQAGETVLVMGGGSLGLMHVLLARLHGCGKIIVAEPSRNRQEIARRFGADVTIDPNEDGYLQAVLSHTGGRGADVIVVACGVAKAQEIALEMAAIRGRISFFGRVPREEEVIGCNSNLVYSKELSILGAYGSRPEHFAFTLGLMELGRMDLRPLITRRFPLNDLPEAYETTLAEARAGAGMKTVIVFD